MVSSQNAKAEASVRIEGCSALVTGGAGFIGSHLVDALKRAGARSVLVLDDLSLGKKRNLDEVECGSSVGLVVGDCADLDLLRTLHAQHGAFDICFNLAVIPILVSLERPRYTVDTNLAMTTAVCELGRGGGYRRLVQFSSSEVYGTALIAPMDEDHPLNPITPYAASKAATDLTAISYMRTFGLPVSLVRPFNTYGPRQNDQAYAGLIPAVVQRVLRGDPVIVHGDGEQTRDYTYVSDVVRGVIQIAECDDALGEVVNLGSGQEFSVNELVSEVLAALGQPDHPVEHGPPRPGDVRRLISAIDRAAMISGYAPSVGLAAGLRETVHWYLRHVPEGAS